MMTGRIQLVLTVYAYGAVGLFLLAAPWSPLWEAATLAVAPTPAGEWVRGGSIRGLVSGLGALNVWVALQEGVVLWRMIGPSRGEGGTG